jgi:acetyl-CoA acetyltransferase family protein
MGDAYIFDALRTPRGKGMPQSGDKPGGALCETPPNELVGQLITALNARNGGQINENAAGLTLGCVGQVGAQGGHIALLSRILSDLPDSVPVKSINNFCVSGLTAIGDSVHAVQAGADGLMLAGGVECLSQVGFLADKASYYTDPAISKQSNWAPPIMGAELIATIEGFEKSDLDEVALASQQKAHAAWEAGHYSESVMPVMNGNGESLLERDELIRAGITLEALENLPAAFSEQGASGFDEMMLGFHPELEEINHIHSFGHCPGMADGAALAVVGSKDAGLKAGLKPKVRMIAQAECAGDPILQFTAGFAAMEQVLTDAGMELKDVDLIEFMEAFAAIPLKFMRDYKPDPDKVNVNGGHLAMGHPMGATGAILTTTLVHEMERRDVNTGLVVAHAGGGIGSAMIIERV